MRCIATSRRCEGYADNIRPWIFDARQAKQSCRRGSSPLSVPDNKACVPVLDLSPFNDMLASPYKTREDQTALAFWLSLTDPEATDSPVANQCHYTLGAYIPQAAWHLEPVRHSLLSAASTALVLEARSANMAEELQHSLSKQSIIHMHQAIHAILEEKEASLSAALTAVLLGVVCLWTGRWTECRRNLAFCRSLSHEVRSRGEYVADDLFEFADSMYEVLHLLPSVSTKAAATTRVRYAYQVITAAQSWIEDFIQYVEAIPTYHLLRRTFSVYNIRMKWILRQWQNFKEKGAYNTICVEDTAFGPAVRNVRSSLVENKDDCSQLDLRLLTTQLTLALKVTAIYGACGDAQRLRQAAVGCHSKVAGLPGDCDES